MTVMDQATHLRAIARPQREAGSDDCHYFREGGRG